jgi:hypothetical protein
VAFGLLLHVTIAPPPLWRCLPPITAHCSPPRPLHPRQLHVRDLSQLAIRMLPQVLCSPSPPALILPFPLGLRTHLVPSKLPSLYVLAWSLDLSQQYLRRPFLHHSPPRPEIHAHTWLSRWPKFTCICRIQLMPVMPPSPLPMHWASNSLHTRRVFDPPARRGAVTARLPPQLGSAISGDRV